MPSNITPIHQYMSPHNAPQQQDWYYPPGNPGCAPSPPSCFSQVSKADACWDQSQALYNLVSKVVMDIFQTNPGIIPPPPPSAGGPILGVTDGSNALPGNVGEFLTTTISLAFAATGQTQQVMSTLIIPPGDWDVTAWGVFSVAIDFAGFNLSVIPAGVSGDLRGQVGTSDAGTPVVEYGSIAGSQVRANVTVPTLLALNVVVVAATVAGTISITVSARRRR